MKYLFLLLILNTYIFASLNDINSFEADFIQIITDEKKKKLQYSGHIIASKPFDAKWTYSNPIKKTIYINRFQTIIVEPEIEQVIQRNFEHNFNFFNMIKRAKKIGKNRYETKYNNISFIIEIVKDRLESISYLDQFDNSVKIIFKNQKQNKKIDKELFIPKYPSYFDLIKD